MLLELNKRFPIVVAYGKGLLSGRIVAGNNYSIFLCIKLMLPFGLSRLLLDIKNKIVEETKTQECRVRVVNDFLSDIVIFNKGSAKYFRILDLCLLSDERKKGDKRLIISDFNFDWSWLSLKE